MKLYQAYTFKIEVQSLDCIESWGRGYEKIMTACDAENLVRPTFVLEQGGITANIPRERFMTIIGGNATNVKETDTKPTDNRTEIKNTGIVEKKSGHVYGCFGKDSGYFKK